MPRYLICLLSALTCASALAPAFAALPVLRAGGTRVVDPSGKPVVLRECNLGNWLMIEPWMLGGCVAARDQGQITDVLRQRFGDERGYGLMELYREHYITPRDLELIKGFGFNVVRVPFDFRLLQDENPPYAMRADAFKWLDRVLELAENAGVYVILDMHGVPQGQSNQMHTGRSDQPELWKDPDAQQRMIDLWVKIAQRYKDRSAIAAYDIVNEPYADYKTDVTATLRELMFRAFEAVRSTGDNHVILFPGALGRGVYFYGDVRGRGYEQFAFTDHYYPGLFGSPSTLASHAHTILRQFPEVQKYLDAQHAPFLAGEFNTVLDRCGGERMMRRYYDEFAARGWMATMWSYKLLKRAGGIDGDNWYMVTNADPLPAIDIKSDSYETIATFMESLSTVPLVADEPLRTALTEPNGKAIELPPLPDLPTALPKSSGAAGWTGTAVNSPTGGAVEERDGGRLVVTAAGRDVFGTSDSFYFVHRAKLADSRSLLFSARVESLLESGAHAKAGLMIRFGEPTSEQYASAPFVMVNAFPDGTVAMLTRDTAGASARETKRFPGPLPRRLGLLREGDRVRGLVEDANGRWVEVGEITLPAESIAQSARVGLAVSSHQYRALTRAEFSGLSLTEDLATAAKTSPQLGSANVTPESSLIRNGSFAAPGDADDSADAWNRWGTIRRMRGAGNDWSMTASEQREAGLWQDVTVKPGEAYAFAVTAFRDGPAAADSGSIELRLEAMLDGRPVALASSDFDFRWLESTGGASTLVVQGRAISESMRILIRVNPTAKSGSRVPVHICRATLSKLAVQ